MSRTSTILLEDTIQQVNVVGEKVQGAAFHGISTGNHTIAITNQNFTGRLFVEASLAEDPKEEDWFIIDINPTSTDLFIEYTTSSGVFLVNFTGNYIWLRARINRDHLSNPEDQAHGAINKILLNF